LDKIQKFTIIHISSEVYPFSKTGGLADVAYSLAKEQSKDETLRVVIFSPFYTNLINNSSEITSTGLITHINSGSGIFEYKLCKKAMNNLTIYFLSNEYFFGRSGFYAEDGKDYEDNDLRFGTFCNACLRFIEQLKLSPNIIHCHDWQSSFAPIFMKTLYRNEYRNTKSVLTIHNLAFQGIFHRESISRLSLPETLFHVDKLEYYGKINYLKGAIIYADMVTTVSISYAEEIKTTEFGCGLDGIMSKYSFKLKGILNGIDYDVWNPEHDDLIYKAYNRAMPEDKEENKKYITGKFGLSSNLPLFGMVSRLTEQKGADIIGEAITKIDLERANFIFLGDGDNKTTKYFEDISKKHKNVTLYIGYDEALAHEIYAASDFYLMPSRFEPCGLSQMIAMRYGTIPLVRNTGGLKDSVVDVDLGGYGIVFSGYSSEALLISLQRAIKIYYRSTKAMRKTIMGLNFSWTRSAKEYIGLYKDCFGHLF